MPTPSKSESRKRFMGARREKKLLLLPMLIVLLFFILLGSYALGLPIPNTTDHSHQQALSLNVTYREQHDEPIFHVNKLNDAVKALNGLDDNAASPSAGFSPSATASRVTLDQVDLSKEEGRKQQDSISDEKAHQMPYSGTEQESQEQTVAHAEPKINEVLELVDPIVAQDMAALEEFKQEQTRQCGYIYYNAFSSASDETCEDDIATHTAQGRRLEKRGAFVTPSCKLKYFSPQVSKKISKL